LWNSVILNRQNTLTLGILGNLDILGICIIDVGVNIYPVEPIFYGQCGLKIL